MVRWAWLDSGLFGWLITSFGVSTLLVGLSDHKIWSQNDVLCFSSGTLDLTQPQSVENNILCCHIVSFVSGMHCLQKKSADWFLANIYYPVQKNCTLYRIKERDKNRIKNIGCCGHNAIIINGNWKVIVKVTKITVIPVSQCLHIWLCVGICVTSDMLPPCWM